MIIYKIKNHTGKVVFSQTTESNAAEGSSLLCSIEAADRRWGRRMAERGGEPRTFWQGLPQSCVAGTETTFFIWRLKGSRGKGMDAGTNRVRPRWGGIVGITGTEEITGFNPSTTERNETGRASEACGTWRGWTLVLPAGTESDAWRSKQPKLPVQGGVLGLCSGELPGEESQWRPGTLDLLLEDGPEVGIKGVYSKGNMSSRFRVSQYRNRGKELLGVAEGGVKQRGPWERLAWTLEGVCQRS